MLGINMRVLRIFMGWTFAIASVICFVITVLFIRQSFRGDFALSALSRLICSALFLALTMTFGVAWWTIWTDKPSARRWGVAASSIHVLLTLWMIVFRSYLILSSQGFGLALGVVGLIAFRSEEHTSELQSLRHLVC